MPELFKVPINVWWHWLFTDKFGSIHTAAQDLLGQWRLVPPEYWNVNTTVPTAYHRQERAETLCFSFGKPIISLLTKCSLLTFRLCKMGKKYLFSQAVEQVMLCKTRVEWPTRPQRASRDLGRSELCATRWKLAVPSDPSFIADFMTDGTCHLRLTASTEVYFRKKTRSQNTHGGKAAAINLNWHFSQT